MAQQAQKPNSHKAEMRFINIYSADGKNKSESGQMQTSKLKTKSHPIMKLILYF